MKSGQISVLDTTEEWYNAYEKDIAVANFYYSKPTSIGKCIFIDILYSNKIIQNTDGQSTWGLLTLCPSSEDCLDFAWDLV